MDARPLVQPLPYPRQVLGGGPCPGWWEGLSSSLASAISVPASARTHLA